MRLGIGIDRGNWLLMNDEFRAFLARLEARLDESLEILVLPSDFVFDKLCVILIY